MFNFYRAVFPNPKTGKKLHIIKSLMDMRERDGVTNADRAVLFHAICYIKNLEEAVGESHSVEERAKVGDLEHVVTVKSSDERVLPKLARLFGIEAGAA